MYQNNADWQASAYGSGYFSPQYAAVYNEKKHIRKAANYVCIPLIALMLLMQFWNIPVFKVAEILKIDKNLIIGFIRDSAGNKLFSVIISSISFLFPFILTVLTVNLKLSDVVAFGAPQKKLWFPFWLIGMGFCSFANIATSFASQFFSIFNFNYDIPTVKNPDGVFGFLLTALAVAAAPALVEEFALRGVAYGLLSHIGEGFAVITTSILFGFMHGNFSQLPFAFLVGLVLGYVRAKTGSVWICMLIHASNNLVSVIMSYLSQIDIAVQNVIYICYLFICIMMFFAGILLLKNFRGDFLNFKNSEGTASPKQKFIWFFTAAPTVIFLCICILQCISFISF